MTQAYFADMVLKNGVIYTADSTDTLCQALAVRDGKIVSVGSNGQISEYIGENTEVIDLQGKMVIPGMIDSHIHPPGIALSELYEVQLFGINTIEGYQQAVKGFISRNPDIKVLYGQGWLWSAFTGLEARKGPRKEHLDAVAPDIPVILRAMDGHSWWVNSKAFEISGITCNTESPEGGIIEKDDDTGELWGTVKETAIPLVRQPSYTLEQTVQGMAAFQRRMHSYGITGVLSIMGRGNQLMLKAWDELRKQDKLALNVRCAITVNPQEDVPGQLAAIDQWREEYCSPYFQITTAKFFADGVVEGGTSYLLEPYAPEAGKGEGYCGSLLWEWDRLKDAFCLANEYGLQIHVHSTGDAATREVLDAFETVRSKIGSTAMRNTITHLQLVHPDDIPRFKDLNVIASVQPYWHLKGPNWWQNVDYRIIGERANREYPLRSFVDQGVVIASSSDYSITPVPYPMYAIDTGVTRNLYSGRNFGVEDITDMDDDKYLLNKEERISVADMLKSFTSNGAYALFMERQTGSLEVGKQADLAVLDQDLFAINPIDIDKVKVSMTFFAGKLVYSSEMN